MADLWPKREESYCRTVSGYSPEKTDIKLCWEQLLCRQCTRKYKIYIEMISIASDKGSHGVGVTEIRVQVHTNAVVFVNSASFFNL